MCSGRRIQRSGPAFLLPLPRAGTRETDRVGYERNLRQHLGMGTTLMAVLLSETTASVAHVGDSRLYPYPPPPGPPPIQRHHPGGAPGDLRRAPARALALNPPPPHPRPPPAPSP